MSELRRAVWKQEIGQTGDKRRVAAPRQLHRQCVHRQAGENKRRQKGCVVRRDWIGRRPLHRCRQRQERQQRLRERNRVPHGIEHRSVPPCGRTGQVLRAMPEQPRVEDRVAGVVRKRCSEVSQDGPRQSDAHECVQNCGHESPPHLARVASGIQRRPRAANDQ